MSNDAAWNEPRNDEPSRPPRKPMNGCLLASLIVGGLGLVGLLVCCGVGAWLASTFVPKVTSVPAEITATGDQILKLQLPDGFKPINATTMDNPFFTLRIAQFQQQEGKGKIGVGSMKIKIGDANQANMQSVQFRTALDAEMSGTLDVKSTTSHDVTMNGQKVVVSISEATDRATGKAVHTAKTDLTIPMGQIFIQLRMDDEIWDEAAVLKMFEEASIP
jgi:hypothetical protein